MEDSLSEEDSSRTGPIKSKRPPFSLVRMFVNMMSPTSRKHQVELVEGATEMSKAKSMHNLSTDNSDVSSSAASKSGNSKKLSKRLSKSTNSVASELTSKAVSKEASVS